MRVLGKGRVRRTEAEWRAILERYEANGLSLSAFCRRARLPRSSFVKWRRGVQKPSAAPAFVEWLAPPVAGAEPRETAQRGAGEFEFSLPGGAVLRWRA
jgi:hypothetical protein